MLKEFKVGDRRVQWLASEDVSQMRMEYSLPTHLKGNIPRGLRYSTPEHLPMAKALYDVHS